MQFSLFDEIHIAIDLETTGFAPPCEIIEIGAVRLVNGKPEDKLDLLIKPERKFIPRKITELTGITYDMVRDSIPVRDGLLQLKDFAGGEPLVAHNADFDMSFIRYFGKLHGIRFENHVIDTLALSRKKVPMLTNHKLGTVSSHFGIEIVNAHRAYNDALAAGLVYMALREL